MLNYPKTLIDLHCPMSGNPDSGIWEIFCWWIPVSWALESVIQLKEFWNPSSTDKESRIQ